MYITLAITLPVPSSKEFSSICLSLKMWTLMTSVAMVKFNLSTNLAWWVEVSFTYTLYTMQVSLKSRGIRTSWKLTSSKQRPTKMSS